MVCISLRLEGEISGNERATEKQRIGNCRWSGKMIIRGTHPIDLCLIRAGERDDHLWQRYIIAMAFRCNLLMNETFSLSDNETRRLRLVFYLRNFSFAEEKNEQIKEIETCKSSMTDDIWLRFSWLTELNVVSHYLRQQSLAWQWWWWWWLSVRIGWRRRFRGRS